MTDTLLMMKLFAFRDSCREDASDTKKAKASHHALDLYRIVAIMTEVEFERAALQIERHQGELAVVEAKRIVAELFASNESPGSLRLRRHPLWTMNMAENMALIKFLSATQDLFQPGGSSEG